MKATGRPTAFNATEVPSTAPCLSQSPSWAQSREAGAASTKGCWYGEVRALGSSFPRTSQAKLRMDRTALGTSITPPNEILLPNGGVVPLPTVSFDFAVVDDGHEIFGTGVAPPGVAGNLVPPPHLPTSET